LSCFAHFRGIAGTVGNLLHTVVHIVVVAVAAVDIVAGNYLHLVLGSLLHFHCLVHLTLQSKKIFKLN